MLVLERSASLSTFTTKHNRKSPLSSCSGKHEVLWSLVVGPVVSVQQNAKNCGGILRSDENTASRMLIVQEFARVRVVL